MRHVKVLRVECSHCKAGPYRMRREHSDECNTLLHSYEYLNRSLDRMQREHVDSTHPTPDEEGLVKASRLYVGSIYKCGFKHKTQVKKWFSKEELVMLDEAGFCLKEYTVPKSNFISRPEARQVLFTCSKASEMKTHSIKEFFNVN